MRIENVVYINGMNRTFIFGLKFVVTPTELMVLSKFISPI